MRRYIAIAVGLGLILVVLTGTNAGPALAQGALKPVMAFIVNDRANPVPVTVVATPATGTVMVRDVDGNGAREIVSRRAEVSLGGGSGSCGGVIAVPVGKRLVIEHLSAALFVGAPNRPLAIGLNRSGENPFMYVPVLDKGLVGANNAGYASQQMHVYSDGDVAACVFLAGTSNGTLTVEVNGYLTDRY